MDVYEVSPVTRVVGSIRPPGSKSLTNRAFVCAALADGVSRLHNVLESDDTRVMIDSLRRMGVAIEPAVDSPRDGGPPPLCVHGQAGRFTFDRVELFAENSGTTLRFLTAVAALGFGQVRLDGNARMRQRPIGDLLNALKQMGVACQSELGNDCPPVLVQAKGISGGHAWLSGKISSQFLSALLMVAPYAEREMELSLLSPLVSWPYVEMTLRVMESFGVRGEPQATSHFRVPRGVYRGIEHTIEPDASAASYFWAAAAITGGEVTVEGLSSRSLQGDVRFCDVLAQMGCEVRDSGSGLTVVGKPLRGIEIDMRDISDTVPTLAAVALFAQGPTTICNVAHVRHKESDRIHDVAVELRKTGAKVDESADGLRIWPVMPRSATFATYDDHRMAMALSLIGLRVPGVRVLDPKCTAKTYPRFFRDLERLCGKPSP